MTVPTVAQVKRYLLQSDWQPQGFGDGTTTWQSPNGRHQVMLGSSDNATVLEDGAVLRTIASATGRTLEQVVADVAVNQEEFWSCGRRCWPRSKPPSKWTHTLRWGDCDKAVPPPVKPAHFDIPVTWTADDGSPSAGWESVLVALFAPWSAYLPPEDQHAMLGEYAPSDFVEAPRPGGAE